MQFSDQQLFELAMAHHRAGRLAEAEPIYRRLLAAHPGDGDVLHLLGLLAHHAGKLPEARVLMQQAIAANPARAHYYNNFALLLLHMGELDAAASACEAALRLQPEFVELRYNLGLIHQQQGLHEVAIGDYEAVLASAATHADARLNLGFALIDCGKTDAAIAVYRAGLALAPHEGGLWNNLGYALKERGDFDEAADAYRTALRCDPNQPAFLNHLGAALRESGELDEALECFRRSLSLNPAQLDVQSDVIFTMQFHPSASEAEVAQECKRWWRQHGAPLTPARVRHANDRSPERRLRIGYVSPDFRQHVESHFTVPLFEAHDHSQFEIHAYSSVPKADQLTERHRRSVDCWHDVRTLDDGALAERIRTDGIDILVDLSMHSRGNRLLVFARQPAPVQVTWLAYAGRTGVETIAYRITDRFTDPASPDQIDSGEEPVCLPDGWCCFDPLCDAPPPGGLPALRRGFVTFGSQNQFSKINTRVLALWARVLRAVEGSRFAMFAPAGSVRDRVRQFLGSSGIASERIEFFDRASHDEYLHRYQTIDLALDSFPFNGMTTTCTALWMGVPVVTLVGVAPWSRAAFSVLSNAGLGELAASSEDDYVRIASSLAADLPRLADLRSGMRDRMKASLLMDAPRFARGFETALRDIWRRWCAAS